jgi:hypothetical protein
MEDIDISDEQDQIQFAREVDSAYFLTQASVLKHFKCKWGQSLPDIMKPTVNDKIRVAMLLFSDDIREFLPDILSKTKSAPSGSNNTGNRPNLDACNSRKKRGKLLLLNAFKDPDVVAKLPSAWKDAGEYIDEKLGEGAFQEFGQFDPNDQSRITLPWNDKSVDIIFKVLMKEFNAAALQWTKGTGR